VATSPAEPWELGARERIRDTPARYSWGGDSLRLDDVTEIGLDQPHNRDRLVPVGDEWLIRHRFVSTDWAAAGSTMVR